MCALLESPKEEELANTHGLETGKALRTECRIETNVLANTFDIMADWV